LQPFLSPLGISWARGFRVSEASKGVVACPVLFEALPPQVESTDEQWQDHLDLLDPLRRAGLAGINVPEIVNGHYKTVEPRSFAAALQRRLSTKAILNRITVHHTLPQLRGWVAETRLGHGIDTFVLVGGESSTTSYPGSGVIDALEALRRPVESASGVLGVITIPTRRRPVGDEPQRLLDKAAAGARFAISQILCEPTSAVKLQKDLHQAAAARSLDGGAVPAPPQLFWSLAPVARPRDLEFLKWLGVEVPPGIEKALRGETSPEARLEASARMNEGIARDLLAAAERDGTPAPGFCVEHVMLSNLEAGIALVDRVKDVGRSFKGSSRAAVPAFASGW
jgi:5,10-methylenetetrahydrofolate reductase